MTDLLLERHPEADAEGRLTSPIQNATENPRVEIRDGQFVFCMTTEAGAKIEQFRSAAQVRQAFTGVPVGSGWLPPGIVRWGNGFLGEWAIGFIPPRVHELEITREAPGPVVDPVATAPGTDPTAPVPPIASDIDRIRVPLPGLVWFGLATTYFIWAVKTETLQPYQEIFRVPLPNTYADGSICWGTVKPTRMTAATLFNAYDLFMGSTFNNHLAAGKSKSQREDVRAVLRDVAGRNDLYKAAVNGEHHSALVKESTDAKYPVDDLVRQVPQTGVTLDQAIRMYFETGEMPS